MSGSYVAFLDPDDAYAENYIENMHSAAVSFDVDIVICRYMFQNTTGKLKLIENAVIEPKLEEGVYDRKSALRSLAKFDLTSAVWNKFYKSDLWKTIRFPVSRLHEDIDTTFRVINLCKNIFVLNKVLYFYRKHTGAISSNYNRKYI